LKFVEHGGVEAPVVRVEVAAEGVGLGVVGGTNVAWANRDGVCVEEQVEDAELGHHRVRTRGAGAQDGANRLIVFV
jgi:hypothetical protein